MDLLMPVLDGFEVTRQLRQLPELKDVVAIALSADVFESTKQKSLAAGWVRVGGKVARPVSRSKPCL